MDLIAEKIAAFGGLTVDARGECDGKVEIVEQLQDSFDDPRVVEFFLGVLSNLAEYDLARVSLCKFFQLNPPTTLAMRRRIAEVFRTTLQTEQDVFIRQWLGIALAGYTDLAPGFEAASCCVLDVNEDENVRHNCLAALREVGLTAEGLKVYKELAAGSDSIAASARRQLSVWGAT